MSRQSNNGSKFGSTFGSNFDVNERTERPRFTDRPKGGFGDRMRNSGGGDRSDRFSGGNDQHNNRHDSGRHDNHNRDNHNRDGHRDGHHDRRGREKKEDSEKEEVENKGQRGEDWFESSEFCRTNLRTGAVMWKEEFYTNKPPRTHMVEPKREDNRGVGFMVPSTWKFQNCEVGSHACNYCGQSFCYEFARDIHTKECVTLKAQRQATSKVSIKKKYVDADGYEITRKERKAVNIAKAEESKATKKAKEEEKKAKHKFAQELRDLAFNVIEMRARRDAEREAKLRKQEDEVVARKQRRAEVIALRKVRREEKIANGWKMNEKKAAKIQARAQAKKMRRAARAVQVVQVAQQ